ncbi:MAG: 50S ribosomal protein L4 [Candidatus Bipolaricaulota bacterium]|nr:50S ribosomal protein L4 [Candidatus Bipolaricaulota bacterium]MCS7275073.1 50S ribosomal protein L4 [Candidatus Bipolaricaulota bacterium]MDW8110401.1 50S ribosomal protein L4 [Candidatus Bipolaricaulota bacterium]MDW8329528.1 50S ribosomal protein L4 [Candidatus Bipolaricaulota bacterium]
MNLVAPYYKFESGAAGEIPLSPKLFGYKINKDLLYRAVRTYLLNLRQGTHSTKTRGEVVGTGKKPWPQKHTGRARHGMRRSPLWKGGGIVFGPKPKEYDYRLPKKMVRRALQSALIAKLQAAQLGVLDRIGFDRPKTKAGLQALERLGFPKNDEDPHNELLLVVSQAEYGLAVKKTFSNLPWVKCVESNSLTVYDLLKYEHVLITEEALGELEARCAVATA